MEAFDNPSRNRPLLPVRMLNEFAYCPRLFHLEWVQGEWADNAETVDGRRVHRRVDKPSTKGLPESDAEDAPDVTRSVYLSDQALGLVAKVDLVEADHEGSVHPVDYKRSIAPDVPRGAHEPERVQVCAQGLLLRAHGFTCSSGFLYFAGSKKRVEVFFDDELIKRTLDLRDAALAAADAPRAPPPLVDSPKCDGCSLAGICLPDEHNTLLGLSDATTRRVLVPADDALPLHVVDQGATIAKDGGEFIVRPRHGSERRVRIREVSNIEIHGQAKITTPALRAAMSGGISVSYYSQGSWFYGRSVGHDHKNVGLRIAQFAAASDPERALALAQRFVKAKIRNSRVFLRRNMSCPRAELLAELDKAIVGVERASSASTLLGVCSVLARGRSSKSSFSSVAKKLSATALSQQLPFRLMLGSSSLALSSS